MQGYGLRSYMENKSPFKDVDGLEAWHYPRDYMGADYEGYYSIYGRHRDSGILNNSNYATIIELFKDAGITVVQDFDPKDVDYRTSRYPDVIDVHMGHWAVGWVEGIMVYGVPKNPKVIEVALEIADRLNDYPILDDEDYYQRESDVIQEGWDAYLESEVMGEIQNKFNLYEIEPKENVNTKELIDEKVWNSGYAEFVVESNDSVYLHGLKKIVAELTLDEVKEYFVITEFEDE